MDPTPTSLGPVRCLARAADAVRDDPIGILLPVGGLLVSQSLGVWAARIAWDRSPAAWVAALGLAVALPWVGGAVLRSRWIAVAARNAGLEAAPWGRPLALLGVQLVVWPLAALALAVPAVPLTVLGLWLGSHGLFAIGAVIGAVGICVGSFAGLAVRSVFALAAPEVVIGGRSALDALVVAARRGVGEFGPLLLLVLVGDLATAAGGLLCGAAALPGYPLTDLAVLHRWTRGHG